MACTASRRSVPGGQPMARSTYSSNYRAHDLWIKSAARRRAAL
jgi:hypothetical protein